MFFVSQQNHHLQHRAAHNRMFILTSYTTLNMTRVLYSFFTLFFNLFHCDYIIEIDVFNTEQSQNVSVFFQKTFFCLSLGISVWHELIHQIRSIHQSAWKILLFSFSPVYYISHFCCIMYSKKIQLQFYYFLFFPLWIVLNCRLMFHCVSYFEKQIKAISTVYHSLIIW